MKRTVIILSILAVIMGGCGQAGRGQAAVNQDIPLESTLYNQTDANNNTVEDTVRYQIGGKLYGLNFRPSDSITVIESYQGKTEWGIYRQYDFIVHNRYSYAHRFFSTSCLDSIYKDHMTWEYYRPLYEEYLKPRLDSIQSRRIDPAIKDFNGYWVYLKEHNGDYYLNDEWSWHASFHIVDSIFTPHFMEGPYSRKIIEAFSISENTISISYDGFKDDGIQELVKIELFDKSRSIYRIFENGRIYFITPARAIHNFEIIQYTNNTGDLI